MEGDGSCTPMLQLRREGGDWGITDSVMPQFPSFEDGSRSRESLPRASSPRGGDALTGRVEASLRREELCSLFSVRAHRSRHGRSATRCRCIVHPEAGEPVMGPSGQETATQFEPEVIRPRSCCTEESGRVGESAFEYNQVQIIVVFSHYPHSLFHFLFTVVLLL